ncbi:Trypanosome variant surface glycoprotein (A-type), putative [Trypanosoma equiperdum]|uniref:Trypanosome variant surface glycoprotein (A-type), putative n=1 Tax=Trypanosoma equiperdum TaxID=5694 RepID=A0A1G4HZA0_TRYEQ|nr:Trypanosome variant surface glycoprotein (A-type), putative [Trypanosoma equiperdum]
MLRRASEGRVTRKCVIKASGAQQTTAKSVADYSCPKDILDMADAKDSLDNTQVTSQGFPTLTTGLDLHSAAVNNGCSFLSASNDDQTALWQATGGATGETVKLAQGFITITPHGTPTSETAVLTQLDSFASSWQKENPSDTPQRVYNKIGALMQLTHKSCESNSKRNPYHGSVTGQTSTHFNPAVQPPRRENSSGGRKQFNKQCGRSRNTAS